MTLDGLHLVVLASLLLWSATLQESAAVRKTSHHNQTPQLEQCRYHKDFSEDAAVTCHI
jgi:hypothetical protein